MNHYYEYTFVVEPPQPGSDVLIALISEQGFESFELKENGFSAFIKEETMSEVNLTELSFDDFSFTVDINKIETINWNEEWEKKFEPVLVDNLLCIRAPFHPENKQVQFEIVIMPKMSFGTGHHQTTRLICKAMFGINFNGKSVLDMGCGTGILAILASKLGAKDILAIDIDDWSVENSIENCRNNGALEIVVVKGDGSALVNEKKFDVILANINKNVLKKDLGIYASHLQKDGHIFLSGFFNLDVQELKEIGIRFGLKEIDTTQENEWAMLHLVKY